VRDVLCPKFDRTFATLVEDLRERGLLDETLVIAMGEFGRSPKLNPQGGRDHWGACFSVALAGAGIPGGQIVGASVIQLSLQQSGCSQKVTFICRKRVCSHALLGC
jgi:uncharacterized protein (DUF1501 family)